MVSDGDTTGRERGRRSRLASVMSVAASLAAAAKAACSDSGPGSHNAFDRLDCRKGRYDLGDMLSWRDRRLRGEARRGRTPADPGPASTAVLLGAAAAGRRRTPKRPKRRDSGHCGGLPIRGMRRRAPKAGYALAMLLAATMAWSCTDDSVGPTAPAAAEQDPGFLTVEWTGPAAARDIGVLIELEGSGIEAVHAPGLDLYQSSAPGRHQVVVAGSLRAGPLVQFRVLDRGQLPLYQVRVLQVTGDDYGLRDVGEYRTVITNRPPTRWQSSTATRRANSRGGS